MFIVDVLGDRYFYYRLCSRGPVFIVDVLGDLCFSLMFYETITLNSVDVLGDRYFYYR